MSDFHGVNATTQRKSSSGVITTASGITFAVGTAPVHTVGGKTNVPVLCKSYDEAVAALGYSSDRTKYTLTEVIDTFFERFKVGPVVFVNVLDAATHKTSVSAADVTLTGGDAELPLEALNNTALVVKASGGTGEAYVKDTDYTVAYTASKLVVSVKSGGSIDSSAAALSIAYDKVNPSAVTEADIIGATAVNGTKTGLQTLADVFTLLHVSPDIVIAPGFADTVTAIAAIDAVCIKPDGLFSAVGVADIPTSCATPSAAVAWKSTNSVDSPNIICCYPTDKYDGKVTHMSTVAAARMAKTDTDNDGIPSESPSNKGVYASALCLSDGTEINVNVSSANTLNQNGIVTELNMGQGYVLWGNGTAEYAGSAVNPEETIISSRRMGIYLARTAVLTYWANIDMRLTPRWRTAVEDALRIWINSLVSAEHLIGGEIEIRDSDNTAEDVLSGKTTFRISYCPPLPASRIEFIFEYTTDYYNEAFA